MMRRWHGDIIADWCFEHAQKGTGVAAGSLGGVGGGKRGRGDRIGCRWWRRLREKLMQAVGCGSLVKAFINGFLPVNSYDTSATAVQITHFQERGHHLWRDRRFECVGPSPSLPALFGSG